MARLSREKPEPLPTNNGDHLLAIISKLASQHSRLNALDFSATPHRRENVSRPNLEHLAHRFLENRQTGSKLHMARSRAVRISWSLLWMQAVQVTQLAANTCTRGAAAGTSNATRVAVGE
jgi:hypothetical protein